MDTSREIKYESAQLSSFHVPAWKASNEILISRKGLIGKGVGFAPMVCMFVGYLIIPLIVIGLTSMSNTFSQMT